MAEPLDPQAALAQAALARALEQHELEILPHDGTPSCRCGEWAWRGPYRERRIGFAAHLLYALVGYEHPDVEREKDLDRAYRVGYEEGYAASLKERAG